MTFRAFIGVMPLWNSSKKEADPPVAACPDKNSPGNKPGCPQEVGEVRDIRRRYDFKEVLGTYVTMYTDVCIDLLIS